MRLSLAFILSTKKVLPQLGRAASASGVHKFTTASMARTAEKGAVAEVGSTRGSGVVMGSGLQ